MRRLLGVAGLALSACVTPEARAGAVAPGPEAYNGVVVWTAPAPDTLLLAFRPEWRQEGTGADSAWTFARARVGEGWAYGRMDGDTLVWGLASMAGDAGTVAEFAGVPEPDGTVRGCLRPPRRGWAPDAPGPRAAFVLRPSELSTPRAGDAPVDRCR
ncbi:MAG TPA: hypothetical protein VLK84_18680 [Longimicrobium sp.]|nr:hypothetical protein [Longimicrobium sp.]